MKKLFSIKNDFFVKKSFGEKIFVVKKNVGQKEFSDKFHLMEQYLKEVDEIVESSKYFR